MTFLKDSYKESGAQFDKVRSPEETLEWAAANLKHLDFPLLQETERIDSGRLGIPVYISRYSPRAAALTGTHKQMGKGITAAQAEASAVMELMERFSLFWYRDNADFLRCSRLEIKEQRQSPYQAMPLEHMKRVFADNSGAPVEDIINEMPLQWMAGEYPLEDTGITIPFSWMWPINEYNGSAAGNSLAEAAVQAISEVVERHVCSVISRDMLETPEIDPDSLSDPAGRELLQRFTRLGIRVVLKDFSLDTGVPTVGAVAWDPSTFPHRSEIVYTAGTSSDPQRAVIRALTEVAQLAGDFDTDGEYVESGLPKFESLDDMEYVLKPAGTVSVHDLPSCASDNFREEVKMMTRALERAGLSVYLLDITHPVLDVPAVYAMIPGNQFRDRTVDLDAVYHCSRVAASAFDWAPGKVTEILQALHSHFPKRFETAFFLAHCLEQAQDYRGAVEWFRKALELEPGHEAASIRCHVGMCLRELGDIDSAIEELSAARDINPGLKEIHNQLGFCYYTKEDFYKAIECFEAAIEIDPGSAIDYANIGSNLRRLGMYGPALKWYEMALELDPELDWAVQHMEEIRQAM